MGSGLTETQTGLWQTLSQDHQLQELITGVFDYAPQQVAYPYILIGEWTVTPYDTFAHDAKTLTATINVWSQETTFEEVYAINDRIRALLHRRSFSIINYTVGFCYCEMTTTKKDPDGLSRQLITRYRIIIE